MIRFTGLAGGEVDLFLSRDMRSTDCSSSILIHRETGGGIRQLIILTGLSKGENEQR